MPINIEPVERWGRERVKAFQKTSQEFWDNSISDLRYAFGGVLQCARQLDNIHDRLLSRFIEYTGRASQEALSDVFDIIQQIKQHVRQRNPNPRLWLLHNPHNSVWQGRAPSKTQITTPFDPSSHRADSCLFAFHGMDYDGSFDEAFRDYYAPMARAWNLFRDSETPGGQTSSVVIVTYDSRWTDEAERLYTVLDLASPLHYIMVAAIWDEMERRARLTAEYCVPFMKSFYRSHANVVAMSHSLGSFGHASLIKQLRRDGFQSGLQWPGVWINMQSAVPDTDLIWPARQFAGVSEFFHSEFGARASGEIWTFFSQMDIVLSTVYFFARRQVAMGQFGAKEFGSMWPGSELLRRHDVTDYTGTSHGVGNAIPGASGYFDKLARYLEGHAERSSRVASHLRLFNLNTFPINRTRVGNAEKTENLESHETKEDITSAHSQQVTPTT